MSLDQRIKILRKSMAQVSAHISYIEKDQQNKERESLHQIRLQESERQHRIEVH